MLLTECASAGNQPFFWHHHCHVLQRARSPSLPREVWGKEAAIRIDTGEVMDGDLGPRAARLVEEWRQIHTSALMADWELAQSRHPLNKIEPLE